MSIYRINQVVIETTYNKTYNTWFFTARDRLTCLIKNRRLRQGVYPVLDSIVTNVNYNGRDPDKGDCIDGATITFQAPCLKDSTTAQPCNGLL